MGIAAFAGLAFVLVGCAPELTDTPWRVAETRILGVKLDTPENAPGGGVSAKALVAGPSGTVEDADVEWAFCLTPKSPAENRSTNADCLSNGAAPAGSGAAPSLTLPSDGCALFGPETPPGDFRPRDPDATGGYYQPIRLRYRAVTAIALARITCNLRSAPSDVALELKKLYVKNRNPTIASVDAKANGVPAPLGAIPAGAAVSFAVHWSSGDTERYALFDPGSASVAFATETLRVSWYATVGALDPPESESASDETSAETAWPAPADPVTTHFWAVLRDSRGGSDFVEWDAVVVKR